MMGECYCISDKREMLLIDYGRIYRCECGNQAPRYPKKWSLSEAISVLVYGQPRSMPIATGRWSKKEDGDKSAATVSIDRLS